MQLSNVESYLTKIFLIYAFVIWLGVLGYILKRRVKDRYVTGSGDEEK